MNLYNTFEKVKEDTLYVFLLYIYFLSISFLCWTAQGGKTAKITGMLSTAMFQQTTELEMALS